ncbi:dihydroorotate dehydrogenase B catalytic subunit [Ligilactobacillus aviarius]|uniref:dihydroorotate dehydrogenase n=1 Tax=Ligilactobacillus aviarius TaxID=1606 RepID=UPI0007D9B4A7|nr:dihydroorotate dehydrogenase [Ligilactobacillus aviarius]OAQ02191.1 dihydroorotate dehydrogenase B catalytic subunit [Ligilactobacillus aviarius]OAQ04320.1 dihydroorotate dehydrogenase B catalytic subunit [Ligilactobacillus aviarius]OAS77386.1 dihydroorotate dehydrogenase B catalytic subunit [Ligilactobacillus aviarius]PEG71416.1 dihydroorotate dehydrogenase B catalytic subunit [Ligilactobacillus aviarius]PEG74138.1 dihydroorotate dehydrogenase B catalytic subunit [Ligilactobacillus aviariu
MDTRLTVNLPGLTMKNPLMPGSGTFGFGDTPAAEKMDLNGLGALVIKTTTPQARKGNPQPQIAMLKNGVINSVGLTNPGVDAVVNEKLPHLRQKYPTLPIVGSIGGSSIADYQSVAQKLADSKMLNALELNISCPNVQEGGMAFGTNPQTVEEVTRKVKEVTGSVPVYVKLSPNVTDITTIAKAAERGGADGLTMINTLLGLHIDVETRQSVIGNGMGGLSGAILKPLAVRMIYQVAHVTDLPIIGIGGVETVDDVLEMFLAGASAVGVGAAHFDDVEVIPHLAAQLEQRMDELNIESLEELRKEVRNEFRNED